MAMRPLTTGVLAVFLRESSMGAENLVAVQRHNTKRFRSLEQTGQELKGGLLQIAMPHRTLCPRCLVQANPASPVTQALSPPLCQAGGGGEGREQESGCRIR
jgi:hypothetical protein